MKQSMLAIACFAAYFGLISGVAEAATLYRWKDHDGNLVVSDRPPPSGTDYETVSTSDTMIINTADSVEVPAPKEPPTVSADVGEPAPYKTVYKKNPEYCKGARQNLELLERPRIRMVGEDGEARILSEEERAEERRKALETIEAHCD